MSLVEQEFTVALTQGLHARPAAQFVQQADRFAAEITLLTDRASANAKGIFGLLRLGIRQGDVIRIRADGPDAAEAVATLGQFLTSTDD